MMILDNDELSPSTSAQTKDAKEIRSANHASSTNETLTDEDKVSKDKGCMGEVSSFVQSDIEGYVQIPKPNMEEKLVGMIEKLTIKVDNLSKPSTSSNKASLPSSHFSETIKESYDHMKEWKVVKNIVELVSHVEDLAIYPMSEEDEEGLFKEGGAILRCETCFSLYKDKANKLTPVKAAQKLASDCRSICTGKYLSPERMESAMAGQGESWRKMKSSILRHMICAEDGQTHFKALTMLSEEKNLKKIHYDAAETLLKSALTAVKVKSAAIYYEDHIAFAFSIGAQVGQCGHSRKLVPDMVKCLLASIHEKTKAEVSKCLPSTGLPPHYYMAVDKATVNKRSNQGVIICPMIDGKKVPIGVGAPEVYSPSINGNVEGSKADDSAAQAFKEITNKFGGKILDFLVAKSILESTAKQLNVKPTVATVYSQTRFASSAYVQWQRIVDSYKLFAEAMAQASNAMENELDPLQYQVRGHDFVTDLLLMHDVFEPVARVMTNLQGISVPPWKAYRWVQKLITWLKEASRQCHENGNMDFFPTMRDNAQNILGLDPGNKDKTLQPTYQGIDTFANDLAESLDYRVEKCITNATGMTDFFDIEEVFIHLCGEKLDDGRIKIKEGELEEHGTEEFKFFFKEVCALKHIKELNDDRFDETMHSSVLHDWKGCIRYLVWHKDMKGILLSCLKPEDENGIATQLKGDCETSLMKLEHVQSEMAQLHTNSIFLFEFANHSPFRASIDEEEVIRMLYTNELLFTKAGPIAMTSFDIAMGGSEAIVESFYSVMDTQKQVSQHHVTLEDRTILDWATSNVLNSEDIIAKAAKFYVDGSMAEPRLSRHRVGKLKRKSRDSKQVRF
ncbi:Hypothetical predicted protein [Paramuricea clavata]|uniref:Uncharacterized protein n=1 Tax=Paramuricea clavata TaxID=317549 RepID=A0A6S7FRL7_PARCT|nr:Hypothetical predicted protein [Paramuricea clavata]